MIKTVRYDKHKLKKTILNKHTVTITQSLTLAYKYNIHYRLSVTNSIRQK